MRGSHGPASARSHRQTLFGLCTLAHAAAAFPPWDPPQPGRAIVAEVRPAHVARALAGVVAHRDDPRDGGARAGVRAGLLRELRGACRLEFDMEQAAKAVEDLVRKAREYTAAVRKKAEAAGVAVETFVGEAEADEAILKLAKEQNAEMIIVGSHGRTGLRRLLMGSVAEAIVRRASCLPKFALPALSLRGSTCSRLAASVQSSICASQARATPSRPRTDRRKVLSCSEAFINCRR